VWSALIALQGYDYDGPAGRIGFKPRIHKDDHASFFSASEGYGLFKQVRDAGKTTASIAVSDGKLRVAEIILSAGEDRPESAVVTRGTGANNIIIQADLELKDGEVRLKLNEAITLQADERIEIELS